MCRAQPTHATYIQSTHDLANSGSKTAPPETSRHIPNLLRARWSSVNVFYLNSSPEMRGAKPPDLDQYLWRTSVASPPSFASEKLDGSGVGLLHAVSIPEQRRLEMALHLAPRFVPVMTDYGLGDSTVFLVGKS
jgi:hypothetical protein